MARTWVCGFEIGDISAEVVSDWSANGSVNGNATLETTIVRTGGGSLKVAPASNLPGNLLLSPSVVSDNRWRSFYLRVTSLPGIARTVFGSIGVGQFNLLLNTDGTISGRVATTTKYTSVTALTDTAKWYLVEVKHGTSGSEFWLEETQVGTDATSVSASLSFGAASETVAATYTAYFDDVVEDSTTRPGPHSVALCVPVSINQAGSWTGGAGGAVTTTPIATKPPGGTATETDNTQVESIDSSGNNATDELRANLTTYTNAGIGASDTINALYPFCYHGEDSATNTKTGSVGMQANPADTYATFTFGGDVGALSTFPINWRSNAPTVTPNPSVTLASSPVIALRKTDSGTRVASCCFLGMYVDYTVASAPPATLLAEYGFVNFSDPGVL